MFLWKKQSPAWGRSRPRWSVSANGGESGMQGALQIPGSLESGSLTMGGEDLHAINGSKGDVIMAVEHDWVDGVYLDPLYYVG